LRKQDDRNRDDVTLVCALFDGNGNYLKGTQKVVELRLKDENLERRRALGVTVNSDFDVKSGPYMIRVVARDAEGSRWPPPTEWWRSHEKFPASVARALVRAASSRRLRLPGSRRRLPTRHAEECVRHVILARACCCSCVSRCWRRPADPALRVTANLKLKAESRLVLVDAVVTGKKDEPVHGLTAKPISTSSRMARNRPSRIPDAYRARDAGNASSSTSFCYSMGGPTAGQSADDQKWIQQAAARFIADNAGPNRLMSVAYYTPGCMTIATPFTADVGQLQKSLGRWPSLSLAAATSPIHTAMCGRATTRNWRRTWPRCPATKWWRCSPLMPPPRRRTPPTKKGRSASADHVAEEPAPEPAQSSALERNRTLSDPKGMQLEFRKADVSVYPVEAQVGAKTPAWALSLADATGGHELNRGNDVVAFSTFWRASRTNPTRWLRAKGFAGRKLPPAEGHRRPVRREGARAQSVLQRPRSEPGVGQPAGERVGESGGSPHAGNTAASASAPFFYEAGGAARVDLALEIPSPVLDPTEVNGKLHAEMDVLGLAYNLGGEVAARFSDTVRFDFDSRQQFDDFVQHPLRYERQLKIAPGNYRFKLIFRTAKDRFGVVETPLAIEPFDAGQLSLSAIALSRDVQPISQEAAQEEIEQGKKPLIFRGNRITVRLRSAVEDRRRRSLLRDLRAARRGAEPVQLTMRLRLLDAQSNEQKWDSGDVDLSASGQVRQPRDSGRRSGCRWRPWPPGTYHAELTVKDSAGGTSRPQRAVSCPWCLTTKCFLASGVQSRSGTCLPLAGRGPACGWQVGDLPHFRTSGAAPLA
jgi:hypothetical protein